MSTWNPSLECRRGWPDRLTQPHFARSSRYSEKANTTNLTETVRADLRMPWSLASKRPALPDSPIWKICFTSEDPKRRRHDIDRAHRRPLLTCPLEKSRYEVTDKPPGRSRNGKTIQQAGSSPQPHRIKHCLYEVMLFMVFVYGQTAWMQVPF